MNFLPGRGKSTRLKRIEKWITDAKNDALENVDDPEELDCIELALERAAQQVRAKRGPEFTAADYEGWTDLREFGEHADNDAESDEGGAAL